MNANLLRAEADALLAILDRLPSMTRFQPAASARAEWDEGRRLLREQIDELVETARDPMGVNRLRATFQFDRVVLGIFSHLDQAEIVPQGLHVPLKACGPSLPKLQGALLRVRDEQLCVPSSVVRDEEVRAELVALVNLLVSISDRLASSDQGQQRGRAAARLEELMTALVDSVDRLELDLDRTGTDLREQNLHFAGQGDDAGRAPLSIGQFVRWLRAIAVPFADAGHRAASLGPDEAELLARELESLAEVARGFQERTKMFGLRRSAPAQQFAEIAVYLDEASREADGLAGRNVQSAA